MDKKFILKVTLSISLLVLAICMVSLFIVAQWHMHATWIDTYSKWIEIITKVDYIVIILHMIGLAYYSKKQQQL